MSKNIFALDILPDKYDKLFKPYYTILSYNKQYKNQIWASWLYMGKMLIT